MVDANGTQEILRRLERIEKQIDSGHKRQRRDLGILITQSELIDFGVTALLCAACVGVVGITWTGVKLRESAKENLPGWVYNAVWGWADGSLSFGNASSNTGAKVASVAIGWAGRDFKPGQTERCADFVREVLKEAGVSVGVAKGSGGPLMADSFHGGELGQIILDEGQLQPGDIIMFENTYNGPGRAPVQGRGRITHVGIYVGGGEIVDRPTAARPVQKRAYRDFFKFHSALRPHVYQSVDGVKSSFVSRYVESVAKKESGANYSAVNPHSGALGKYQFMPATMTSTAKGCIGRAPSTVEFLGSPELQDKIMGCFVESKLATVQAKTSDAYTQCRMMASIHYSGNPDKYDDKSPQSYAGASYPSIAAYTSAVCKGF